MEEPLKNSFLRPPLGSFRSCYILYIQLGLPDLTNKNI